MREIPIRIDLPRKHGHLAGRLQEFSSAARPGRLSIALQLGGDPVFLDYQGPGTLRQIDAALSERVPAGCFAKPLTASLFADAVNAGSVDWSTHVNEVLGIRGASTDRLAGITFRHLLNHTHGLDASGVGALPLDPHGFIDRSALCEALCTRPLSNPGELYSYSNAGAWLAGAALECLTAKPYSRLLSASPYVPSGELTQIGAPQSVCPATGAAIRLTTAHWLAFAELHANSGPAPPAPRTSSYLASLRSSLVPLPGWSPAEQAACLGWKCYGEGWFGHTANTSTSVSFLRFNPSERIAIVISATNELALFAFSCLFRDYFPDLKTLKFPRRLTRQESESLRTDCYTGVYAQSKTRIEVTRTDTNRLTFTIGSDDPALSAPPQLLDAAEHGIFFPDGKRTPEMPFVQFVPSAQGDSFTHIWNGKRLWRKQS